MTAKKKPRREGWAWLLTAAKWHYFRDGRSLCGSFLILPDAAAEFRFRPGADDAPENCSVCREKRKAEKAAKHSGRGRATGN